jgi:DNA-directed RNA polymerase subunit L
MENQTIDFAQALIEELQEDNLFDIDELFAGDAPKALSAVKAEQQPQINILKNDKTQSAVALQDNAITLQNPVGNQINQNSAVIKKSDKTEPVSENNHQISLEYQPNFQAETKKADSNEDYKKTIFEISSLKTIEQLFFSVEQEQLKINSIPYDTVAINMALLGFQKGSVEDEEKVYSEIEKWQSYLLDRDEQISLKDLRVYCETTTPRLSSRALLTLAEFYQNVSRSKFEMLLTRTFSQEDEESERRHLYCDNEEITHHLKEICTESNDESVAAKMSLLKKFGEDLDEFESINGMLATDYFGRYQLFKQELGDLFYDPRILGLIVQNNVLIGNHFVTLVENERAAGSRSNIFNKESFGVVFEESISEVVCKTFNLDKIKANSLKQNQKKTEKQVQIEQHKSELRTKGRQAKVQTLVQEKDESSSGRVMKIVLLCLFLTAVIVGIGYFTLGGGLLDGDGMSEAEIQQNESNRNDK